MLRSNAHLNVKRGHSLDNTCSFGAANLATKNSGNHRSWEFNFQKSSRTPVADPRGGGGLGTCLPPHPHFFGFFLFSLYRNEVYEQKVICSIKRVRNLSQYARNGHSRDSHFRNFWDVGGGGGGMSQTPLENSRLRRSLCPLLL